jgi:uncharacterized protein YraI
MKLLVTTLLILGAAHLPAAAQAQWAYACTREAFSSVNIRRGPGQNFGIVASVPTGGPLRPISWVWGQDGKVWYRVESGGIVGYSRSDYVCY